LTGRRSQLPDRAAAGACYSNQRSWIDEALMIRR